MSALYIRANFALLYKACIWNCLRIRKHSRYYPPTYIRTVWFSFYFGAPDFIASVVHTPAVTSWFLTLHSFETSVIVTFRRKHNGKVCRPCTCLHSVFYAKTSFICRKNKELSLVFSLIEHAHFCVRMDKQGICPACYDIKDQHLPGRFVQSGLPFTFVLL